MGESGMTNQTSTATGSSQTLPAKQVYIMAVIYLVVGLAIGYLFRGAQSSGSSAPSAAIAGNVSAPGGAGLGQRPGMQPQPKAGQSSPHGAGRMPTMEQMSKMADKQAEPLLEKLKSDPKNSAVLAKVGAIYYSTHQFKQASLYYGKSVQADPKNVGVRTMLAISLYPTGDVDGAIAQLNQALSYDPKDANALFDLGMMKMQGKKDSKGALGAWQQLLKSNPQLGADRRAEVQKLIAGVQASSRDQQGIQGAGSNEAHKTNSN
jgi:cytochrome c-type biogenesis protein CcmH/NrfG